MKVIIIAALVVLSNYCCAVELDGEKPALDEDLALILDIKVTKEEELPRLEKSLLGTFPIRSHSQTYNPRARQPLTSSKVFNRQQFEETVQQQVQHHGQYQGENGGQLQGGHHDHNHGYHEGQQQVSQQYVGYHDYNIDEDNFNKNIGTETPLLKFPFKRVEHISKPNEHQKGSNYNIQNQLDKNNLNEIGLVPVQKATIDQLEVLEVGEDGRKCVKKVMMREETEYDEILTCDHTYDNRCHTSYVTRYDPHQEEECEEKFRKICTIDYEQKANQEVVQVCTSNFIPDCDVEGEQVCQTVWTSECSTVQIVHEVDDDIANCETIDEEKCEDVTDGYGTKRKCDTWPIEKCTISKQKVKKYTPQTSCKKVPKEACSPRGCGVKEGPVQCQDTVKTVLSDNPVEECDMEPLRTCKTVTKLVPRLDTVQDCVDVPKEVCARSKVNPRKVKKPSIQKWCFTPQNEE